MVMPQSNMRVDNHIDGLRRFRITLDGTCAGSRAFQPNAKRGIKI